MEALTGEALRHQAEALAAYLAKRGNRGASFWLDSKDFRGCERAAILVALYDLDDGGTNQ